MNWYPGVNWSTTTRPLYLQMVRQEVDYDWKCNQCMGSYELPPVVDEINETLSDRRSCNGL